MRDPKRLSPRSVLLFLFLLASVSFPALGFGQNTFQDPHGRFALDIPEGYKLSPQTNSDAYIFKGNGPLFVIGFDESKSKPEELFKTALDQVKSIMPNAELEDQIAETDLNGNPARWGIYKGTMEHSGQTIPLWSMVGGAVLKQGGIYFVSTYNEKQIDSWQEKLKTTFQSVQNTEKPASPPKFEQETYEELTGRFTIDLPEGYRLAPQTNGFLYIFKGKGPQFVITFFKDEKDSGKLFKMAVEAIKSSIPNAAPQDQVLEMDLNGNPAHWGIYKGSLEYSGQTIPLWSMLGSAVLEEGGVYFFTTYNKHQILLWQEKLKITFQSLRSVGTPILPPKNVKPVNAP